ncbi:MAG: NAD(P)/FAD-dependent oxidoreductase [Actinomycetota bacterium]|nr:NAD(P)/FAD-dependent oxidoreductase [Actinomycetota bacterium]
MTPPHRVVVVGASIGGTTAAETLRHEGFEGEIILIGDERHQPYLRPPLSKQILLGEWEPGQASIHTAAQADDLEIDLRLSCTAVGLDVAGRVVRTSAGDVPYDEVIVATGSEPRRHPVLPMAMTLRTMDDALALRDGLRSAQRVGVIGAGVLGSEIASAARKSGADTLLVGRSASLTFGGVGALLSSRLIQLHEDHGVELALHAEIVGVEAARGGTSIDLADGRTEVVDLVVAMIGATPRTQWLDSSTLTIDDGVVCDSVGRAAPGVSAVGDVAAWENPFTGRPARVEHQSNAIEQAVAVALRIVHGELGSQPVPMFWSQVHGARIHAYGWFDPERQLVAAEDGSTDETAAVLLSRDSSGQVRGAVGWNAPPREFRTARAAVLAAPVLTAH